MLTTSCSTTVITRVQWPAISPDFSPSTCSTSKATRYFSRIGTGTTRGVDKRCQWKQRQKFHIGQRDVSGYFNTYLLLKKLQTRYKLMLSYWIHVFSEECLQSQLSIDQHILCRIDWVWTSCFPQKRIMKPHRLQLMNPLSEETRNYTRHLLPDQYLHSSQCVVSCPLALWSLSSLWLFASVETCSRQHIVITLILQYYLFLHFSQHLFSL